MAESATFLQQTCIFSFDDHPRIKKFDYCGIKNNWTTAGSVIRTCYKFCSSSIILDIMIQRISNGMFCNDCTSLTLHVLCALLLILYMLAVRLRAGHSLGQKCRIVYAAAWYICSVYIFLSLALYCYQIFQGSDWPCENSRQWPLFPKSNFFPDVCSTHSRSSWILRYSVVISKAEQVYHFLVYISLTCDFPGGWIDPDMYFPDLCKFVSWNLFSKFNILINKAVGLYKSANFKWKGSWRSHQINLIW